MRYIYLLLFVLLSTQASAVGVKIYVGSADNSTHMHNHFFMQLIVCNNTIDTVFIRREDLDYLYPQVTNDVAQLVDGGSQILVTNLDELVEPDQAGVFNLDPDGTDKDRDEMEKKKGVGIQKNDAIAQRIIEKQKYYVIPPQKCITVNSYTQLGRHEISRLRELSETDREQLKAYLGVPVWLTSSSDFIQHRELLISRKSKALKKCLLFSK